MPIITRLETLVAELLQGGYPQCINTIQTDNGAQQKNVMATIAYLAKKNFVELRQPASGQRADWQQLSQKKVWVVCPFGTATNEELMRQAAVEVLCARTNECCPQFRMILLCRNASEFSGLPPITRLLTGVKHGKVRILDLGDTNDADPAIFRNEDTGEMSDPGMHIIEPSLEQWLNYDNVEDACGDIAGLQERIFNSDPDLSVVKYSRSYGKGAPYIRILRDALKFNIVVHTLDLTHSECGDVVGVCLSSILYTSRKLKTILLNGCSLTDVGVAQLAQSIRGTDVVRKLSLSRNPSMTDASLIAIASIFSKGSKSLLEDLDISYNNAVYDTQYQWTAEAMNMLWENLGVYGHIKKLNISCCGLEACHLTEAAALWLRHGSDDLEELSISHNYLGDEVVAAVVSQLKAKIRILDLEHVQLSQCGFRAVGYALADLKLPVTTLILDGNNATTERPFNKELIASTPLSEEMLRVVQDSGTASALYVVESLSGNFTLKNFSFARAMIGDAAVMSLCEMLVHRHCGVEAVDISGNCNVEEESAHKLKELLVGGYFVQHDKDAGELPPPILSLSLAGNSTAIGERALLAMYHNKGLKVLDVSNMALVDAMLLPLNEGIRANPHIRLERLLIGRNNLWHDGVANIAAHLSGSSTLKELSIANTWAAFDDEAGRQTRLSKSKGEGMYYLSPLLTVLEREPPPPLEVLDLSGNDISESCLKGIAASIRNNSVLKTVWLLDNPLLTQQMIDSLSDHRLLLTVPS